jgi:lipoprotein-anchoring transpeptidase ErfK/SrfK
MDLLSGYRWAMHAAADALRGLRRFGFCRTTANARTFLQLAFLSSVMTVALLPVDGASADVNVRIDLSRQQMTVAVDGAQYATWAVSTARRGYRTPVGRYKPYLLKRVHYSSIYDNAPMPYSIFFLGGYAIHGTTEVRNLGRPVSHGCIRLTPSNARALFGLVQRHGMPKTTITIVR